MRVAGASGPAYAPQATCLGLGRGDAGSVDLALSQTDPPARYNIDLPALGGM